MSSHAILSASSSKRWLNCPPSAKLCAEVEDTTSEYAKEGTDAHTLCEYKVKSMLGIKMQDPTDSLSYYNEEMERCANDYASYVMEVIEDAGLIESLVNEVISENAKAIEDYHNGRTNMLDYLVGQVMKKSKGKANPVEAKAKMLEKIN